MQIHLGVLFRALGGPGAVRLAAGSTEASTHRLGFMQRLGLGTEKLERARYDGITLQLPDRIDVFPDRADNAALYEWLAAFFVHADAASILPPDPLQADLARLRAAVQSHGARDHRVAWTACASRAAMPCPARGQTQALPVRSGGDGGGVDRKNDRRRRHADPDLLAVITDTAGPLGRFRAKSEYRAFLPVPLWGEVTDPRPGTAPAEGDEEGGGGAEGDGKRRKASRRESDQTQRDDPLMLNRFEKILGLAEMVNLNRKTEDDTRKMQKRRPRTWMRSPWASTNARHRPG